MGAGASAPKGEEYKAKGLDQDKAAQLLQGKARQHAATKKVQEKRNRKISATARAFGNAMCEQTEKGDAMAASEAAEAKRVADAEAKKPVSATARAFGNAMVEEASA
jgi:hypothetical protein